jgi:hypothetical protein
MVLKETIVQFYASTEPEGTTAEKHCILMSKTASRFQGVKAQEWLQGVPSNYRVVRRKAA